MNRWRSDHRYHELHLALRGHVPVVRAWRPRPSRVQVGLLGAFIAGLAASFVFVGTDAFAPPALEPLAPAERFSEQVGGTAGPAQAVPEDSLGAALQSGLPGPGSDPLTVVADVAAAAPFGALALHNPPFDLTLISARIETEAGMVAAAVLDYQPAVSLAAGPRLRVETRAGGQRGEGLTVARYLQLEAGEAWSFDRLVQEEVLVDTRAGKLAGIAYYLRETSSLAIHLPYGKADIWLFSQGLGKGQVLEAARQLVVLGGDGEEIRAQQKMLSRSLAPVGKRGRLPLAPQGGARQVPAVVLTPAAGAR